VREEREVEVLEEDRRLVARVLVEADLADAQDAGPFKKLKGFEAGPVI